MSLPICDYAIIGDTHTTALVSRDGSVDWLCWPRHDSPALFLRLLDDDKGGACRIEFEGSTEQTRRYLPDTNILETSFDASDGAAVLTDFMPVYPPTTMPEEGPDGDAESRLIRILFCTSGTVVGRFVVRPTFDYARLSCDPRPEADGSVLFEAGEHRIRVTSSQPIATDRGTAMVAFRLHAGERMHLVLTQGQDGEVPCVQEPDGAMDRLRDTARCWRDWIGTCTYEGEHAASVRRSALFLKLMTYAPTGAIIAAPTLGLPEAVPGNRNFDYRYAWLRDASFTMTAFVNLGYRREAKEYLRFLCRADGSHGRDVRVMYGVDGAVPAETELPHLAGWRGIGPVTTGNAAADQTQYDIYGELLLAVDDYLEAAGEDVPAEMAEHLPRFVSNLAERAVAARNEPDQGLWETRVPPQHFVHTKALIWVALDRAVRLAGRLGGIGAEQIARWQWAAGEIRTEYLERGWSEARGSYVQAFDTDVLDASVLRIALFDALPVNARLSRTLDAIQAELGDGDLIYRYRAPDGMQGQEGTFSACAFWFASCLALVGRVDEAHARLRRLLARANDVGLFGEEIDAATGEQRGNFPQGFTHMAVINHSVRLAAFETARSQAA
ncbi:MAG: glycoside hydrolase family 15 protein [Acetobacteraceae bacterium]|nr:glycoside hydrolase family 15 protein [Acetobacteraceae bacterium]